MQMCEGDLHLRDILNGRTAVSAPSFADPRSRVTAGLKRRTAVEGDSPYSAAGLATDEQAGAAEAVELLHLGQNGHPENVDSPIRGAGVTEQPCHTGARAVAGGVLAMHHGDLPRVDRTGAGPRRLFRRGAQGTH